MPNYAELTDQGYTTVNVDFYPWDPPPSTVPGWQQVSQAGSNFYYSDDLRTIYSINWIDTGDDLGIDQDFFSQADSVLAEVVQGLNDGINSLDPEPPPPPPDPGPVIYPVTFTPAPEIENVNIPLVLPDPPPEEPQDPEPVEIVEEPPPPPQPDPTPDPEPDPEPEPIFEYAPPPPPPDPGPFPTFTAPDPVPPVEFFSPPPPPPPAPPPPTTMDDDEFFQGEIDTQSEDYDASQDFSNFTAPPAVDAGTFADNSFGDLNLGALPSTGGDFGGSPAADDPGLFDFSNNDLGIPATDPTGLIDLAPDPTAADFQSNNLLDFSSQIDAAAFNTSAGDYSESGFQDPFALPAIDSSVPNDPLDFGGSDGDWFAYALTLPDSSAASGLVQRSGGDSSDQLVPGGTPVNVAADPFGTPAPTPKSTAPAAGGGLGSLGGGGGSLPSGSKPTTTTPTPTTTPGAAKTIVSQVRNGNDLVITYSDGSTQTLKNYFTAAGTTTTTTTPAPTQTSTLTSLLNSLFKTTGSVLGAVTTPPGTVAGKTIKSEIRNGNDLVVSYTDGTSQTIPNYYAPSNTSGTATPAVPKTVVTDQQVGVDRVITYSDGSTATSPGFYTPPVGAKAAPVYKNAAGQPTTATGTVTGSAISPMVLLAGAGLGLFLLLGDKKAA